MTDEQRSIRSAVEQEESIEQRRRKFRPTKGQKLFTIVALIAITLFSLAYASFLNDRHGSEAASDLNVSSHAATDITQNSATLNGTTTPKNITERGFQYGGDTNYGQAIIDSSSPSRAVERQWGSVGSGNGQFSNPISVAVDAANNSYVLDYGGHRVQKFDTNGNYLSQWGSEGTGDGQFSLPMSIAVDSTNNVYVLDATQKNVQKFTSNGAFIAKWGGITYSPYGITIDEANNVYVTDYYRVIKFDASGNQLLTWGTGGSGDGQFGVAYGIAADKNGHIYVADVNNSRIQKFDTNGNFITKWSAAGVYNLTANGSGHIYTQNNGQAGKISEYNDTGTLLSQWGALGTGDGQLGQITGINISANNLIYTVDGNKRVSIFATGISAGISGLSCGSTYHYRAYATNSDGTTYGPDQSLTTTACPAPSVTTNNATGVMQTSATLNGTTGLTELANERGFEYGLSDQYDAHIRSYSALTYSLSTKFGQYGASSADGRFDEPQGITATDQYIYVSDNNNGRIQKFDHAGNFISKWSTNGLAAAITSDKYGYLYVACKSCGSSPRINKYDTNDNLVSSFGATGTGDGQLGANNLTGLAVDEAGYIYVADTDNKRVQKFDVGGNFVTKWGTAGVGDGQFQTPWGIAVTDGRVFVSDLTNNRIQSFDSSGNFVTKWGSTGSGSGQFHNLYGIYSDRHGNIMAADAMGGNTRIQQFKQDGTYISQFGSYGTGSGQFMWPIAITSDTQNNLYTLDSAGSVTIYKGNFVGDDFLSSIDGLVCGTTYHYRAYATSDHGIRYGSDQTFSTSACPSYTPSVTTKSATNISANQAFLLGTSTPFSTSAQGFQYGLDTSYGQTSSDTRPPTYEQQVGFGSTGSGNGQFSQPGDVATDSHNNLYVIDYGNNRIQKFDKQNTYIADFGTFGGSYPTLLSHSAITIDSADNVFVTAIDTSGRQIQKLDTNGNIVAAWGTTGYGDGQFQVAVDITTDSQGNVYAADASSSARIQKFNNNGVFIAKWGSTGYTQGQFQNLFGITADAADNIYTTSGGNYDGYRIQKFSSDGNFITSWGVWGSAEGQINSIGRPYADDSSIYMYDESSGYVNRFDLNGNYLARWAVPDSITGPYSGAIRGIAINHEGTLYVSDIKHDKIQQYYRSIWTGVTNLSCNSTYHYRAFATKNGDTGYGQDETFTTGSCSTPPLNQSTDGRIIYAKDTPPVADEGWCSNIYSSKPDGSDEQQITHDCMSTQPSASPDGTKILITLGDLLTIIDMNGNILHTYDSITSADHGFSYGTEPWSADSRYAVIGFDDYTSDDDGVFKLDTAANSDLRLTTTPGGAANPSFSPNGLRVVFNTNHNIEVVDSDGTNNTALTSDTDDPWYFNTYPTFSSDSLQVYYTSSHNTNPTYDSITANLWRTDVNGNNKTQLSHFTDIVYAYITPYSAANKFLLYALDSNGQIRLITLDTNGSTYLNTTAFDSYSSSFSDPSLDDIVISPDQQQALLSVYSKWNGGAPHEGGLYTANLTTGNIGISHLSDSSNGQPSYSGYASWVEEASPGLTAPQNLVITPHTTSLDLSWDSVPGADYYNVEYRVTGESDWLSANNTPNPYQSVNFLSPDTSFDIRVAAGAYSSPDSSGWTNGSATTLPRQTYHISDCAELQGIMINPYTFEFGDPDGQYVLDNDIDCSESAGWYWNGMGGEPLEQPLGFIAIFDMRNGMQFTGSIDGQGHTVSNVYQDGQGIIPYTGIFASAVGSTFENINFSNAVLRGTTTNPMGSGGLAQNAGLLNTGNGVAIINVHMTNLSMTAYPGLNAGLVGTLGSGSIVTDSSTTGSIQSTATQQAGKFDGPQGVGLDANGNVYIADTGNDRVQKFDSQGNFIMQFGNTTLPDRNDFMDSPNDVAVDSAGNIYVTDTNNQRIQKFNSNGGLVLSWGEAGTGNGQLSTPTSIVVDSNNYIYVADQGNNRLQKFDANGTYITQWGSYGSGSNQFLNGGISLAVDADGNIYAADKTNSRVQKFDASGNLLASFGVSGLGDGEFNGVYDITIGSNGHIYTIDNGSRIQEFDASGAFVASWGSSGNGNGQFSNVYGIAANQTGEIYALDYGIDAVQKFTLNGAFLKQWGGIGRVPYSLGYAASGLVGTADSGSNVISTSYSSVAIDLDIPSYSPINMAGGLIAGGNIAINDSYSNSNIHISRDSMGDNIAIGGLAGSANGGIHNSYASGVIDVAADYSMGGIGGLAGMVVSGSDLDHSFATGAVSGPVTHYESSPVQPAGLVGVVANIDHDFPTLTNNYYDRTTTGQAMCVGAYHDFNTEVTGAPPNDICSTINVGNTAPSYFFNNSTNPPLDSWDFSTIWKTNLAIPPTFLGGGTAPASAPGIPRSLTASSATGTSIDVTWLAPLTNGNSPVTDYVIQYKPNLSGTWLTLNDGVSTNLTANLAGLTQASSYDIRVAAVNAIGQGNFTTPLTTSTLGPPSAPQNLHVSTADPATITLAWDTPVSTGGTNITDYTVQYKLSSSSVWLTSNDDVSPALGAAVYGLTANTQYDFRVAAVNAVGQGAYTNLLNISTSPVAPSIPRNLAVTPYVYSGFTSFNFNNSIAFPHLSWDEPLSGSPITAYTVRYRAQGETSWQEIMVGATPRSLDIDFDINTLYESGNPQDQAAVEALINNIYSGQSYEFQIAAHNAVGQSAYTDSINFKLGLTATDCQRMADNLSLLRAYSVLENTQASFILVQDIDCSDTASWNGGAGWSPINDSELDVMSIYFEGNHHVISNLFVNNPTNQNVAMFGNIYDSRFQNLILTDWDINSTLSSSYSTQTTTATLAAQAHGSLEMHNIQAVTSVHGYGDAGGLIGSVFPESASINIDNIQINGGITVTSQDSTSSQAIGGIFAYVIYPDTYAQADININNTQTSLQLQKLSNSFYEGEYPVGGFISSIVAPQADTTTERNVRITNSRSDNQYSTRCNTTSGLVGMTSAIMTIDNTHVTGDIACDMPGYFNGVRDLAIGPDNTVIAADSNGYTSSGYVKQVDANGNFLDRWKLPNLDYDGRFSADQDGALYYIGSGLRKLTPDHQVVAETDFANELYSHVTNAKDIAVGNNKIIYITDGTSNRVVMFSSQTGAWLGEWGSGGTNDSQFQGPNRIVVDGSDNIYVSDSTKRIQKFDAQGNFITAWDTSSGEALGVADDVVFSLAVQSDGTLYVARGWSSYNEDQPRVQKFSPNGSYLGQFVADSGEIAVDSTGIVYVAQNSQDHSWVNKYAPNGSQITHWANSTPSNAQIWMGAGMVGLNRWATGPSRAIHIIGSTYEGNLRMNGSASGGLAVIGGLVGWDNSSPTIGRPPDIGDDMNTFRHKYGVFISDSSSTGAIASSGAAGGSGGLVGIVDSVDIQNSYSQMALSIETTGKIPSYSAGGAVGYSAILTSHNSHASGNISVSTNSLPTMSIGGYVGLVSTYAYIDNTYATGNISTVCNDLFCLGNVHDQIFTGGVGGLAGLLWNQPSGEGWVGLPWDPGNQKTPTTNILQDSYATGDINIGSDGGSPAYAFVSGDGGLVGTVFGSADLARVHSSGDIITDTDLPQTNAGGLIGNTGLPPVGDGYYLGITSISDASATGDVRRSDKTPTLSYLSGTGGLIGANYQGLELNKAFASGSVDGPNAGGLIGTSYNPGDANDISPLDGAHETNISNVYTTGDVTSRIFKQAGEQDPNNPTVDPLIDVWRHFFYQAGGLVSLSYNITSITNSYASGVIFAASEPLSQTSIDLILESNQDPMMGIMSQLSDPKIGGLIGTNFVFANPRGSNLTNNFGAAINQGPSQTRGGLVGLTMPLSALYAPNTDTNFTAGFNYTNNYYDAGRFLSASGSDCGHYLIVEDNPSNPSLPSVLLPSTTNSCTPINADNSRPDYFKNNHINPPLNTWDFNTIWKTNLNTYPDFVGSSAPTPAPTPTPPTPATPTPTHPPTPRPSTRATPVPTPTPAINPTPVTPNGGSGGGLVTPYHTPSPSNISPARINDSNGLLSQLRTGIGRLAPGITYAPGSLILLLIMLAIFYMYQSWREHQAQIKMERLIRRFQVTQRLRSDFINITSHYLNTPVQIMSSSTELAYGKLPGMKRQVQALEASLKIMSDDIAETLKSAAQLSPPAGHVLTSLKTTPENHLWHKPGVWLPVVSTALLLVVFDIIIMVVGQLGANPYVLGIQLCFLIFAGLMIIFTYRARARLRRLTDQTMATLKLEEDLDSARTTFIRQTAKKLDENLAAIRIIAMGLISTGKVPELANGLGMAEETLLKLKRIEQVTSLPATNVKTTVAPWLNANLPELKAFVKEAELNFQTDIDSNIEVALTIDSLAQLVSSLVGNSVKFTPAGGSVILKLINQKHGALLLVQDTGNGIDPNKLQNLLQPFTRGTDVLTYDHEGIGLSLYIDQLIVERVGGSINIISKPRQGTKVTVRLPTIEV